MAMQKNKTNLAAKRTETKRQRSTAANITMSFTIAHLDFRYVVEKILGHDWTEDGVSQLLVTLNSPFYSLL